MQDPGTWVIPLSDRRCADASFAGGKAAELHLLHQEGLPVPDAFVVPVAAFSAHFDNPLWDQRPDRPQLSAALSAELAGTCEALCAVNGPLLAVRSSALAEDGVTASFAGQHATYYYVTAADIDKAITDCWLSLWSDQALAYRSRHPEVAGEFAMAVIVQRMIQSERSGVCFTDDPTGANPGTALLESTWGLGAALVDGRVSPDRFWIAEDGSILDRKIARKRLKVSEDLEDPSGARLEPVPLNNQVRATLTDIEVAQIVDIARQIAARRGFPQDVEWAIAGDELFLLQSRPITAVSEGDDQTIEGRWVLFKPAVENFSEPFTPMTVDLLRRVMPPIGRFIRGRYYLNADLMEKLLPWSLDDETLSDLLLLRGPPPGQQLEWRRALRTTGYLTLAYLAGGITWHRTANLPQERLQAFERRCEQVLADETLDPLKALQTLILNHHPFRPMGEFAIQANVSAARYFILIDLLKKLLERIAPAFDQTKLSIICAGGAEMLSHQMVEGIRELAATAREDDALRLAMLADDVDLQSLVIRLEDGHPFSTGVQRFMQRFGHRAVRELDLMAPRWREDTTTVLSMVRNYVAREAADPDAVNNHEQQNSRRIDTYGLLLAAEDELHQAVPHRWQRMIVDHFVRRIRYYVALRENTRHYHTMGMATVRMKLKRLEQELMQLGRLRCEDDIFFLEHNEAMSLGSGELDWPDVESLVRDRRLRYQRLSQQPPTQSFNVNTHIPVLEPDRQILAGSCACPGVATGKARIIRDPSIAADLAPGEILVAPYTDPAWTPLFPGAAAIIVEIGSYLSHAGTVAREYQVPCLVDVHDCTRRIRSGQQLRVNATEGWVEIVS